MKTIALALGLLLATAALADSISTSRFSEVVGWTVLGVTQAKGEFNGADFGKLIGLDNGAIFEFEEYGYSYAYRPDVVIFARRMSLGATSVIAYKLLIDGGFYDARLVAPGALGLIK